MRTLPLLILATFGWVASAPADDTLFRTKVAPILERRCVSCHNDANAKGKLSLATPMALLKGGDSGPALEVGKPDESVLVEKIVGKKPEMPKSGEPLTADEIAAISEWIKSGANWPQGLVLKDRKFDGGAWWSLQAIPARPVPATKTVGWARTPIDSFILAKLETQKLAPSPEADRRTLIRRLTFDLTGLPPTSQEINAFLADMAPNAYEKVVDRLLASPAYGERWGRHWLDLAHYGDTHGYDKDKRRNNAWPYRDYVIDAFNRDLPYTRFVQEQLAGDVLFPDDPRGIVATGFIAAGPWDFVGNVELREGTVDKEKTRLIDRDDMVTTAMSTFASMTVHCARCHDHKFDPIPQGDYYQLQAVFAGVERGDRAYEDAAIRTRRTQINDRIAAAQAKREKLIASISDPALRNEIQAALAPKEATSPTNGYHSGIEAVPDKTKWVQVDLGRPTRLDQVRLVPARPVDFPDTPGFGFPELYRVELADEPTFQKPRVALIQSTPAPNPGDQPVIIDITDKTPARYIRITANRLWLRTNDYIFALGELQAFAEGKNVAAAAEVTAFDSIEAGRWSRKNLVDGYDSRKPMGTMAEGSIEARIRLRLPQAVASTDIQRLVDGLTQVEREIADAEKDRQSLPPSQLVYAALPRQPRAIAVLNRGDVEQRRQEVSPGALSCISEIPAIFGPTNLDEGARRAALARWVTHPANPLTWRSIVNRVWQYHFGRGLVDTPSDFGRNGSKPTHSELLDWLALHFRDSGGSFKSLHRLIVTSAVYRQTSGDRAAADAIDADNRLLWRMNRSRLDAEEVRDSVLFVSGSLDRARGGPGFEPFRFKDDHSPIYDHEDLSRALAADCRKRSIYRFTVRSVPHPFLDCMDAADPNINVPVRSTTITALQALALWNDPFMLAQANAMVQKNGGGTIDEQVARAVMTALGRPPRPDEAKSLAELARKRGMTTVCRLLFNTNEFLFID